MKHGHEYLRFFDMDVLIQILTDWSTATGIGIIAVVEKGEYMMDPIGWKDFCMKYTRGTKEGLRRCVKCDQEGQGVYFCHAGLIDFTADIKIGDHFIGKLVGGQVLPQPPDEEHFRNLAVELGIDPDEYIEALQDITVRTEEGDPCFSKTVRRGSQYRCELPVCTEKRRRLNLNL